MSASGDSSIRDGGCTRPAHSARLEVFVHSFRRVLRPVALAAACAAPALAAAGAALAAIPAPVSHWSFDESQGAVAGDSAGSLHGTVHGAPTRVTDGFAGGAIHFDGVNDRVVVADDPALRADNMALSLWVRGDPDEPPVDDAVIFEKGDVGCAGGAYALVVDGAVVKLRVREVRTHEYSEAVIPEDVLATLPGLWDGEWHHIGVGIASGQWGDILLVVDGRHVGGMRYPGADILAPDHAAMTTTQFSVGMAAAGCARPAFRGDVDDLRLYDRYLNRVTFAELEPPIQTSLELGNVASFQVGLGSSFDVTFEPLPYDGRVDVLFVDAEGREHVLARAGWDPGVWAPTMRMGATPEIGGSGTLVVRYSGSPPWLAASDSVPMTIARAPTEARIGLQHMYVEGDPVRIGVSAVPAVNVKATGRVELYERVDDALVFRGAADLPATPGSYSSGTEFWLAARPPGNYEFVARYSGDVSLLPSESADATIDVLPLQPTAPLLINDGAAYTRDAVVTLTAPVAGATYMQYRLDGAITTHMPYMPTRTFPIADSHYGNDRDGPHLVEVRFVGVAQRWSEWSSDTIVLDRAAPSVKTPVQVFPVSAALANGRVPVRLVWSGADATSGVTRYELRQRVDDGSWTTVNAQLTRASATLNLLPGHTYRYAVRAWDKAGNVSAYVYGTTFALTGVSEASSAIRYTGTWGRATATGYWGGAVRYATASSARASFTFTGRSVGLVTTMSRSRGKAAIYVNGAYAKTIDLYSASWRNGVVAWSQTWSTSARRTVEVRLLGTAGRPRVDVDGWVVGT